MYEIKKKHVRHILSTFISICKVAAQCEFLNRSMDFQLILSENEKNCKLLQW